MTLLPLLLACSSDPPAAQDPAAAVESATVTSPATLESQLKNGTRISQRVVTGGQPEGSLLAQAPALGFDTVINLRTSSEMPFDEATMVQELGMTYVHIPISGAADLTAENAAKLQAALLASEGQALVHCASGGRVKGLMAMLEAGQ